MIITRHLLCSINGYFRRLLKLRRSRADWPTYDTAYLWYGEEAYEFNHSRTIDEYIDVLGTLLIIEHIHASEVTTRLKDIPSYDRKAFKTAVITWWLRQTKRGRPNLSLKCTYQLMRHIHLHLLIKQNGNKTRS